MRRERRLTIGLMLGSLLAFGVGSSVSAECTNVRTGRPISRPIVFAATVTDVVTSVNQDYANAGEGDATDWATDLRVTRVFRGDVGDRLALRGTTIEPGFGTGCGYFLGDRLVVGERLLVALDEQIDFATNTSLYGDVLVWHRVDDGWRFYSDALQDGHHRDFYPSVVREPRTVSQILAVISGLAPDTSVVAQPIEPVTDPPLIALMIAFISGLAVAVWRMRRRAV